MTLFATVGQRTDLCPKARIAAGGALERDRVASLAEGQVFLGCRTVQNRIGEGDRMRSGSRKMAISMAGQTGKICGGTVHPGNSSVATCQEEIVPVTLGTLTGPGVKSQSMISAIGGNPACRMFTRRIQAGCTVVCGSASPE